MHAASCVRWPTNAMFRWSDVTWTAIAASASNTIKFQRINVRIKGLTGICHYCDGSCYTICHTVPWTGATRSSAKGGIEFPNLFRTLCIQWAKDRNGSATTLFFDVRKAFYSVLPKAACGSLITKQEFSQLLLALAF